MLESIGNTLSQLASDIVSGFFHYLWVAICFAAEQVWHFFMWASFTDGSPTWFFFVFLAAIVINLFRCMTRDTYSRPSIFIIG